MKIEIEIGENLAKLLQSFRSSESIQYTLENIFQNISENADKFKITVDE